MKTTTEKAAAALELLPEEMREPAVQYLLEQAEKFACSRNSLRKAWMTSRKSESPNGILTISYGELASLSRSNCFTDEGICNG